MTSSSYVASAFRILPTASRRRLVLVIALLAVVSLLDLVAVVLVLGLTAFGAQQVGNEDVSGVPGWVERPLDLIGAESVTTVVSVLGLVVVGLFVGKSILATLILRRVLRFLARQEAQLTHRLMAGLMRAPLTFHLRRSYIDVMTDITVGAESLVMRAVAPAVLIASEVVLIVMLVIGLLVLAPLVALGSVVYFALVLAVLNRWIGARASAAGHADVEATKRGMTIIQWALGGFREVTTRGVGGHFVDRLGEVRARGAASRAEVAYLGLLPRYFLESALIVGMAVAFAIQLPVVGFAGAISGLALFAVAGFRLLPSLQRLQANAALIKNGQPFGERALAMMTQIDEAVASQPDQTMDHDDERVPPLVLGDSVEAVHLSFTYPGADRPALLDVEASFPARKMTALVGASGSGKSTLVDVLLGLLPPTSGGVLVDGVPLAELRRYWLRLVGYVPQSVFLMSASIRENVALGLPGDQINDDMVWQALRRASMGDTIEALPGGLDYQLGDTGSGLSGGQRQRLGIARALYHSPQVLILDEATSALDVETEAEITDTLAQLDGLTKIVVAHRLSTVKHAERVLFLRAGQVVASGSFAEVSAAVPDFARQVELSGMGSGTGT
jgi:ABC-type multidrug transport system fused ATPase/permease subunit